MMVASVYWRHVIFGAASFMLLVLLAHRASDAGVITDHVWAGVAGSGSFHGTPYDPMPSDYSGVVQGDPPIGITGSGNGNLNGNQTFTSYASFEPFFSDMASMEATSVSDKAGTFVPAAFASAAAGWSDIIFLSGPGASPAQLQLHFELQGQLGVVGSGGFGAKSDADFYLRVYNGLGGPNPAALGSHFSSGPYSFVPEYRASTYAPENWIVGFSSFQTLPPEAGSVIPRFSATYDFNVDYDANLGGYAWNALFVTQTQSWDGAAVANLSNSISLDSVTLTNGMPLTGYDVQFDSGATLGANVVPEPSSLLMMGGLFAAFGIGSWRNRRRPPQLV